MIGVLRRTSYEEAISRPSSILTQLYKTERPLETRFNVNEITSAEVFDIFFCLLGFGCSDCWSHYTPSQSSNPLTLNTLYSHTQFLQSSSKQLKLVTIVWNLISSLQQPFPNPSPSPSPTHPQQSTQAFPHLLHSPHTSPPPSHHPRPHTVHLPSEAPPARVRGARRQSPPESAAGFQRSRY